MSKAPKRLYEFDNFCVDVSARVLLREGKPVPVSPKVFETLLLLVERHGEIVSKDEMMSALWPATFVEEANLSQNIFTLRKILGEKNGTKFIETVPRRGYRFAADVRSLPTAEADLVLQQQTRTHLVVDRVTSPSSRLFVIAAVVGAVSVALVLVGAAAILIGKLGGPALERSAPNSSQQQPSIKRITYDSRVLHSAISPDGRYVAIDVRTDTESGPKESLRLQNIATGSSVEIMPPAMPGYVSPSFSPDGDYLYFGSVPKGAKTGSITRVPVFGGTPQYVVHDVWSAFSLSPDGEHVAFIRSFPNQTPTNVLLIATVKDGKERQVTAQHSSPEKWMNIWGCAPVFTPDGQRLVVTGGVKDQYGVRGALFEATIEGGGVTEIATPRWVSIQHVAWLRDGQTLVVTAQEKEADPFQLWQVNYPSGETRRLTNDLTDYGRVTVTADGKSIAAQQTTRVSHIWLMRDGSVSEARQLTSGLVSDGHSGLGFSPEGRILFTSNRNGAYDIWTMDAEGNHVRRLTAETGGRNTTPVHTPDGRYIVLASNRTGVSHIWRTDPDGNNPVQLTNIPSSAPAVSPDSGWVYFINWSDSPTVIERVSIDGGQPIRVTNGKYSAGFPSLSPDGKLLAHTLYDEEKGMNVAVMSAQGGDPIKLFGHAAQHIFRWRPDSRAFIFIKPVAGNMPGANLWLQSIDGGDPVQLTMFNSKDEQITNFALSADGKQILIARGRLFSDVVLLSNFR